MGAARSETGRNGDEIIGRGVGHSAFRGHDTQLLVTPDLARVEKSFTAIEFMSPECWRLMKEMAAPSC